MKRNSILAIGILVPALSCAQTFKLTSPDQDIELMIDHQQDTLSYQVLYQGQPVLDKSALGMTTKTLGHLFTDAQIDVVKQTSNDDTWTQPWGEEKHIRNHYNELLLTIKNKQALTTQLAFRVFDDGIGFQYRWPQQNQQNIVISSEQTEFNFTQMMQSWTIPAYGDNRYEYLYQNTNVDQLDAVHTPATFEADKQPVVTIHEAALTDFPAMALRHTSGSRLKAELIGWQDGDKAKLQLPHQSSWRTIQIVPEAKDLVSSYLMLNLNEPNKLGDVSWVKPGKYVGVWWEIHLGHTTWSYNNGKDKHGANNENVKRYIDFAADHGFSGVLVEGWNRGWDNDWVNEGHKFSFTQKTPDFDLAALSSYGKEKGVSIVGHHETSGWIQNYEQQLNPALDLYEQNNVKVIKTGYVSFDGVNVVDDNGKVHKEPQHGQYMVRHYRKVIEQAAKRKISIVAHEPIKDTGIRRTYPNFIQREGVRGQEFNAWAEDGGNPPEHTVIIPFTRNLAAPVDFTPGIFDLTFDEARPNNRVNTTLAKQLALYVALYAPQQMVTDMPQNYLEKMDAFQFIKDVPVNWYTSFALNAEIGNYYTMVRKDINSDDWYLGSITDENPRTLDIDLSFLQPNKRYQASIYRDADDAHWLNNPHAYTIETKIVTAKDKYQIKLAAGGGQAIRFKALNNLK